MDLNYAPEYEQFRAQLRDFIATHEAPPPGRRNTPKDPVAIAWQHLLIEHGYAARTIPKEFGGAGMAPDILKARIIAEEFAQAGVSPGLGGQGISMLVPTLLEVGSAAQKQQFIAPTIRGEMVWCQGYSEPGAGSDLANLKTSAVLAGDDWIINGQKIWTSTAHLADWMFCLVRTEPDAAKHRGISFLLFRMNTPGIEVRPLIDMTMHRNFNEVFFTDVRVPKDQIVGRRGDGWMVANVILKNERDSLADANQSLARLNLVISLMKTETVDGQPLIENPQFLDRLMRLQGRVMAMQYNELRVLSSKLNPGQDAQLARLITKYQGTELRHELEALAIDAMGERGLAYGENPYLQDQGSWQFWYMFYLGLIIGGGTSQIQKNIISEHGLGMPREPKASAENRTGAR
jgi:alkylation response protein AidB-like acyl-CoA dehydrogenase